MISRRRKKSNQPEKSSSSRRKSRPAGGISGQIFRLGLPTLSAWFACPATTNIFLDLCLYFCLASRWKTEKLKFITNNFADHAATTFSQAELAISLAGWLFRHQNNYSAGWTTFPPAGQLFRRLDDHFAA